MVLLLYSLSLICSSCALWCVVALCVVWYYSLSRLSIIKKILKMSALNSLLFFVFVAFIRLDVGGQLLQLFLQRVHILAFFDECSEEKLFLFFLHA